RARDAGGRDVGQEHDLLVPQLCRDPGEVRLRVRNADVLGLRSLDRVAQPPAAEGPVALVLAALRQVPGQARAALATRRDRSDQHAIADRVAGDARAELLDDTHRLVPDDAAGIHRILAADDV